METDWNSLKILLEQLKEEQRLEQESILERRPHDLPELCRRIEDLTARIEALTDQVAATNSKPPARVLELIRTVQELGEQNHLLVQNHLRFLNEVFATVFPERRQSQTYDALGRMAACIEQAGLVLDTRS
jgi:DNA-binding transcriptional ArsR family regulator